LSLSLFLSWDESMVPIGVLSGGACARKRQEQEIPSVVMSRTHPLQFQHFV
jgi:hypothetical protein